MISMVAVTDLLGAANLARSKTYLVYEPLLVAAGLYILLAFLIEAGFRRLERRDPLRAALKDS